MLKTLLMVMGLWFLKWIRMVNIAYIRFASFIFIFKIFTIIRIDDKLSKETKENNSFGVFKYR
jgi:hypothetical protein